jgi:hypothetical protein
MTFSVQQTDLYLHNLRTRMPFRYGIAVMTALPALFVRLEAGIGGQLQAGVASDILPPKWFTKDRATPYRDEIADMLRVVEAAARLATELGEVATVFDLWQQLYADQQQWAEIEGYPPLLWNFGVSLIERAAIDAFCRATGHTLAGALRSNSLGLRLADLHPELAGQSPTDLLPPRPRRAIIVRHTVGMADPITDSDIPPADRLDDGLPQSLESCIQTYGLTHFKIKLSGDSGTDLARLERIAALLCSTGAAHFAYTLDGNEQYQTVGSFKAFWQAIKAHQSLVPFLKHLLFVEQPLPRTVALSDETREALHQWPDKPPTIIDESDSQLDSLPVALECGYAGASHKNCKGVFKGVANACLLAYRRRGDPDRSYILSGEDLANVGPVALLQDLAMMASLGLEHVERNGHHYFAGLGMFPARLQADILANHPDLYRRHERGFPTLNIQHGTIAVDSVVQAPFGVGFEVDFARFTPLENWSFDSLALESSAK